MKKKKVEPFLCKNEHLLGEIRWNGQRVPQLMVYRKSLPADGDAPVDMLGPVTGAMNVPCTICGEARFWGISISVAIYLIESMPAQMLFQFWEELLRRAKMPTVSGQQLAVGDGGILFNPSSEKTPDPFEAQDELKA